MTEVAFHFGAADKIGYACRLLRKAVHAGASIEVVSDLPTLERLNGLLWAVSATDFITHCGAATEGVLRELSAVQLSESPSAPATRQVLVNLGSTVPTGFDRYRRLIEVVGTDEEDRATARARWKHYASAGYTIVRHDLALKAAAE